LITRSRAVSPSTKTTPAIRNKPAKKNHGEQRILVGFVDLDRAQTAFVPKQSYSRNGHSIEASYPQKCRVPPVRPSLGGNKRNALRNRVPFFFPSASFCEVVRRGASRRIVNSAVRQRLRPHAEIYIISRFRYIAATKQFQFKNDSLGDTSMQPRRRIQLKLVCLEERAMPASNILQVTPLWINPIQIREFTPAGDLVRSLDTPSVGGLDSARDVVVSPNGDIQLFNGTFSPRLDTYHPDTGTWTGRTTSGWSTVNNLSYGGIAAFGDYVYVTDMQTAYETAPDNGIIRFNMADDTVERFAAGNDYIAMCLGLDGFIYAMGGQNIDKYDPITMAYLGTFTAPVGDGRGVAVAANGDYYVGDYSGDMVYRYDSAGNLLNSQHAGNAAVDISTDGQVISGNALMDTELNIVATVGDGNYHAAFATPQFPILTPILSGVEASPLAYQENAPATAISTTIELTDNHSSTIAGASVAITNNFTLGDDVLAFADANGITGSYDASTGVLTLSGVASVADYQSALRNVTYANASQNPSTATRTVSFQVDDGRASNNLSNTASRDIAVTAVNDAPALAIPVDSPTGFENTDISLNGIIVADVDAANGSETLSLTVPEGTIRFTDLTSVSVVSGANDSASIAIAGTIAQLNEALRDGNLFYHPVLGFIGTVIASLALDDSGNTGIGGALTDTKDLAILVVHGPPQLIRVESNPLVYVEGHGKRRVTTHVKVLDAQGVVTGATIAITDKFSAAEDVLTMPVVGLGISSNYDPAKGILTLSGSATVAKYQRALRAVRYSNTSRNPSTNSRTISFQITDGAAINGLSNVVSRSIQIRPVNNAPVLTVLSTLPSGLANTDIAINGITAFDVDSNGGVERLTLHVSRGTIRFVSLAGLTIVRGSNGSSLVVVEGTVAQLNDALASDNLLFHPVVDFKGTAVLGLTLNDLGNTGFGIARTSHRAVRIHVG
jgi:hypothetical protein